MKKLIFLLSLLIGSVPTHTLADELIVKVKNSQEAFYAFDFQKLDLKMLSTRSVAGGQFLVVNGNLDVVRANPFVEYAEPNFKVHALDLDKQPPAPDSKAWGVSKINAPKAWKKATGKGVVVAVIDTGVDYSHPALKDKVIKGHNFVPGAKDPNDPMDDNSHGTHVSGTIVGDKVGVAPGAKVLAIKFLDSQGSGDLASAIDAIHYANLQKVAVESNSWGGGEFSQALYDVIKEASDAGILFIAAAGNDGQDNDQTPSYPASYDLPNVISVAATDQSEALAYFSNYGQQSVHIAAPGMDIYSSVPGGKYEKMSGTSMATPHASGVVALMLSHKMKSSDVKQALMDSCDPNSGLNVVCQGQIDAVKAVK